MAEDMNKKVEELQDETLDEVAGGGARKTIREILQEAKNNKKKSQFN